MCPFVTTETEAGTVTAKWEGQATAQNCSEFVKLEIPLADMTTLSLNIVSLNVTFLNKRDLVPDS